MRIFTRWDKPLLALLCAALLLPAVARGEALRQSVADTLAVLDLSALEQAARETQLLPGDLRQCVLALCQGKAILSAEAILPALCARLLSALRASLWRMTRLLAPALLVGMVERLRGAFAKPFVATACRYTGLLFVGAFLVADMREHVQLANASVQTMAGGMQALYPLLLTLLTAIGGTASAAFFQPAVVAASGTMTTLVQTVTMPFTAGLAVLTLVDGLCAELRISRLRRLFGQVARWTLGLAFTVFMGATLVQGLGTAAVDGVSIRTAKYAIDNFVPIVGGMFADTVDTLVGCSLLIKNAVGVIGLMLLLAQMATPMLQTLGTVLLYRAAAAVLEPVAASPLCDTIGNFAEVFMLLFIIQLSVGAMFLLLVAQMLVVGNLTVMLR